MNAMGEDRQQLLESGYAVKISSFVCNYLER